MIFLVTSQVRVLTREDRSAFVSLRLFADILETNKVDYIDFQEVEDALRPIFEEVAFNDREQAAITDLCQFVCDQLRL